MSLHPLQVALQRAQPLTQLPPQRGHTDARQLPVVVRQPSGRELLGHPRQALRHRRRATRKAAGQEEFQVVIHRAAWYRAEIPRGALGGLTTSVSFHKFHHVLKLFYLSFWSLFTSFQVCFVALQKALSF